MRTPRVLIALAVVLVANGAVSATAQAPGPRDPTKACPGDPPGTTKTCGDHYLHSPRFTISQISGTLQGFSDSVDTSKATTQPDIFKPSGSGTGPPEPTVCNGAVYGKTIWYDFVPRVSGDLLVQAVGTGFNPVIALLPYRRVGPKDRKSVV